MTRTAVAIGLALAVASAAAQDKTINLRFSYWIPPKHQLVPSTQAWGESLAKATNGTLKVTIYPSNQLGKGPDHYDMAKDGIADFVLVNPGYTPGRFPVIAAGEMPFLTSGSINGSPGFDEWYRKYAPKEMIESPSVTATWGSASRRSTYSSGGQRLCSSLNSGRGQRARSRMPCGLWMRWIAASASDRLRVMTKSAAAKPSIVSTMSLPRQSRSMALV